MKKAIVVILCMIAVVSGRATAQNKVEGPVFKFIDGETHDFGVVKKGPP